MPSLDRASYLAALALAASFSAVAACGGEDETTPEPAEASSGDEDPPAAAQRMVDLTPESEGDGVECALQTVYFAFDSDTLDEPARNAIAAAVQCYRDHGMPARLHLTGSADPRGTEEYNLALGERRAQAVQGYLVSLGLGDDRVSVSSVGEELASGTDEGGWARDRNVSVSEED